MLKDKRARIREISEIREFKEISEVEALNSPNSLISLKHELRLLRMTKKMRYNFHCEYSHYAGVLHYLSAQNLCLRSDKISLCGEFLCEKRIITKICQYICNVAACGKYIFGSVFYSSTVNFDNSFVVGNNGCSTLVCIMCNDIIPPRCESLYSTTGSRRPTVG